MALGVAEPSSIWRHLDMVAVSRVAMVRPSEGMQWET